MSAENNLSESDVKKSKYRKTEKILRGFEGFKLGEFLNYCKKNSELVFQNKMFEVYNDSNKTGKFMFSDFYQILQ